MERTSSDLVYEYVLDQIKTSELTADDKIQSENALSEALNVSRLSVRQALDKLEALGMITKVKGSGTYINNPKDIENLDAISHVVQMSNDDIASILEFRKYFESGNVKQFILNGSDSDRERLKEVVELMRQTSDKRDYGELDYQFHKIIAEGSKNNIVIRIQQILMTLLKEQQILLSELIGNAVGNEFHDVIYRAIDEKDMELASLLMVRHIEAALRSFKGLNERKDNGYSE